MSPDWEAAALYSVRPVLDGTPLYLTLIIGMVGTSIAPWMQFYLQAAVVEKGITAKDYAESRIEVIVGCIVMVVIAFFIIVACAAAIWQKGPRDISERRRRRRGAAAVRRVRLPAVLRRACSTRRCSPPASCRSRRPTRCARGWASSRA